MAVKPSKSDESQADSLSKDRQIDNSVMLKFTKNKQIKIPLVTSTTPTIMLLEKKTAYFKGTSEGINNDAQEASNRLAKSSWSPHVGDSKSKYDEATLVCQDPLYQNERRDSSKYNKIPSPSLPVQACGSIKSSSQLVNGKHGFLTNSSAERVGQTATEGLDMDQKDCSSASTSLVDYKDDNNIDDSLYLGPDSSLTCTVYNTSRKRSRSFLEKLSHRCIQDDPTEASMEQECLIFSDKMKQLLKRSKKGSIHQPDSHEKLNLPCPSPVTVHFSGLEEQEEFVGHLDAQTFFGQKIKVHMSDREDLEATTEGEKDLHSKKSSQGAGTPIEHAGVSAVTAECAELYEEKMNNVCAVRKVPSTLKHMERGCPRSEPSNYFDFCDQMKREMDNSFRSNLNSVVKKSRKTKYRFFILETSDDVFFEETKVQLEAEGHTAVHTSEFFLDKGSSSSLLIILRNEDIAEHICEVPHLLALKKSPDVQFAGIDETDDVVNLTHQELFTKGGLIMLDGAALEPLSLCDMKKMSEILQELSKTGKWKWMLHYRDSRRLKENARLSQEAKEKKQLLNWCQEAGIIEVLPYHECDLMSRDQPDYLTCLVRLQVQNISARYTVFITDTATDSKFESNGIITTTFNSFLTCSPGEAFSV
ncbi:protein TASOR 2 [Tautogolabrus adspersus]